MKSNAIKNIWAILTFVLAIVATFLLFVYGGATILPLTTKNNAITILLSIIWFVAWTYFIFVWGLRLFCSIKTFRETGKFNTFFVTAKKNKDDNSRGI